MTTFRRASRPLALGLSLALLAGACGGGDSDAADDGGGKDEFGDPGNCAVVDIAVSSEKIDLMTDLAKTFNGSEDAELGDGCGFVRVYSKASGGAADLLAEGWPQEGEGAQPVIWSPASTSWGQILNQRLKNQGQPAMTSPDAVSFMLTPLVIGMPKPMADALGYPATPIGWADIARLATSPEGWAAYGHPEWGTFKLGKTNPNYSTSGLSALISQTYAAAGKDRDLSVENLADPKVIEQAKQVESSVVHYGDITMTFLNNWFRTDREGTSLLYASAVAVEEKSLIDYNTGNPDGVLTPGEQVRPPKVPLVAIYPKDGTLFSDNPLYVLDAPWVDAAQKEAAEAFIDMVQQPEHQRKVLQYGFRPGNPDVAVGAPITAENGVDPNQPSTLLEVPSPEVMLGLLDSWRDNRKGARVLLVLDISGSMKLQPEGAPDTMLEMAKEASVTALDEFSSTDEVGFRVFTTNLGPGQDQNFLDLLSIAPMSTNRERLINQIRDQFPQGATPLYDVLRDSYEEMSANYDPSKINAIVLLTDGANDDGEKSDDAQQLRELISLLSESTNGERAKPIRIFPIQYGEEADFKILKDIAEATNAAAYSAKDPKTIDKVFTAVLSNF